MTVRSKSYLQGKFANGQKPTGTDFSDQFDSFVHKTEDSIAISKVTGLQDALNSAGGIKIWEDGYATDIGYKEDEFVSYAGKIYRSIINDNGLEPPDDAGWEIQSADVTVDSTVTNGSGNPVSGDAVHDFVVPKNATAYNGAFGGLDRIYFEKNGVAYRLFLDDVAEFVSSYGFTPANLTGVKFWGDITDPTKVIVASGKISQITDKSPSANNLVQASSGAQPSYFSSGGSNNKAYISLSDGKTILKSLTLNQPYTIYMVARVNDFLNNGTLLQFSAEFTNGIALKTIDGVDSLTAVANSAWRPRGKNFLKLDTWVLLAFRVLDGGIVNPSINNQTIQTVDAYGDLSIGTAAMSKISIGGDFTPNFDLSELLVLDHVPSVETDAKIRNYFLSKYQPPLEEFLYAYGDSITAGFNSTDRLLDGYVAKVAQGLGINHYNYGISGTSVLPSTGTNLIDIYNTKNLSRKGYLILAYGTNDTIDATWKSTYKNIIQYFIERGFDLDKICIVSPPYQSDKLTKLTLCRQYCSEISTELGIRFADWWTWSKDNGGDSLLADGTHPTTIGHTHGSTIVLDALA